MFWAVLLSIKYLIIAKENDIDAPAPLAVIMWWLQTIDLGIKDENSLSTVGWQVIGNLSLSPWSSSNKGAAQIQAMHFLK